MNSITEGEWTYSQDDSGKVTVKKNGIAIPPPTSVFKFFGENRVEDFTKGIFYAAHPSQFNDPFECSPKFISHINQELIDNTKNGLLLQLEITRRHCMRINFQNDLMKPLLN